MERQRDESTPPVDLHTLFLGLARRWRWLLGWSVACVLLALTAGLTMGSRTYQAETVLLYRPQASVWTGTGNAVFDSLSFETQRNLVKVRSNMEEIREFLSLPASLAEIGQSVEVTAGKSTDLMVIAANWDEPELAAALANTSRDVFLRSQVRIRYREELGLIRRLLRESRAEQARLDGQIQNLERITGDIEARINKERTGLSEAEGLGNLNIRAERLRDAIYDDQTQRANIALFAQKEIEYDRAKELVASGTISELEFEEIRAEYESLKALAIDTDEIASWRSDLQNLYETVIPSDGQVTASAPLLQEVLVRSIDLEFERAAVDEKVRQLESLEGEVLSAVAELEAPIELEDGTYAAWLADADFRLITPAREPVLPSRSNRKIVAIGTCLVLLGLGFAAVAAFELFKRGVRSAPEARLRLGLPVLGSLPRKQAAQSGASGQAASLEELYRVLVQRIRFGVRQPGARILVTSSEHGEGKTSLTVALARSLAEQGARVLAVDASREAEKNIASGRMSKARAASTMLQRILPVERPPADAVSLAETLLESEEDTSRGTAAPHTEGPLQLTAPVPGIDLISLGADAGTRIASTWSELADALDKASRDYDAVLIDGPPILPYADAQVLAQMSDAVLLVARSEHTPTSALKAASARMADCDPPVLGLVLNETDRVFLRLE